MEKLLEKLIELENKIIQINIRLSSTTNLSQQLRLLSERTDYKLAVATIKRSLTKFKNQFKQLH